MRARTGRWTSGSGFGRFVGSRSATSTSAGFAVALFDDVRRRRRGEAAAHLAGARIAGNRLDAAEVEVLAAPADHGGARRSISANPSSSTPGSA